EKAVEEASQSATLRKAEADHLRAELEQRALEIDSKERAFKEESGRHALELSTRTESLNALEADLTAKRTELERERTAQTQRFHEIDTELQGNAQTLEAKAKELAIREKAVAAQEADLRSEAEDLETRTRELETKENQAESKLTELSAQAMALVRREQDLNSRDSQIDEAVKKFHTEE